MNEIGDNEVMQEVVRERTPSDNLFEGAIQDNEVLLRNPFPSEMEFFAENPHVGGMATEDERVIINPYSKLTPEEKNLVMQNELARVIMKRTTVPEFEITPEQQQTFAQINQGKSYGSPEDIRATILGRIVSGDPTAGNVTAEQQKYANYLKAIIDKYTSK